MRQWSFLLFLVSSLVLLSAQQGPVANQSAASPLVPVQRNGKWGYVDASGRTVIAPQFDGARSFSDGLAAVSFPAEPASPAHTPFSQATWGFIDARGTTVIPPKFVAVGQFSAGLAAASEQVPFNETETWGYINKQGDWSIKPQFNRASVFSEGLALVWAGGVLFDPMVRSYVRMGYINQKGQWVIASRFSYFFYYDFSEGVVPFKKNFAKWGYMNTQGKVTIKPVFDWAGEFSGGVAPVEVGWRYAEIDHTGKIIRQLPAQRLEKTPEQNAKGTYITAPRTPPCSVATGN